MTLIKAAVIIPTVISGMWLSQPEEMNEAARARHDSRASVGLTHDLHREHPTKDQAAGRTQDRAREKSVRSNSSQVAARESKEQKMARVSAERSARLEAEVLARRIRIERILGILDQLAEASNQMNPDTSARIEPVVLDIAERTLELTEVPAMLDSETDEELEDIEVMLARLVGVVTRMIEPEMSL